MNSVYDVIEVLSAWRGFTMKEVALRAGLSYTTFASMMSRRPVKIAKRTLQSIGTVFGTEWYTLLGSDSELVPEFPPTTRYGMRNINGERVCAMMDEKAVHAALKRIIGDNYTRVLYKVAAGKRALAERVETSTHSRIKDRRGQFDACVDLVFNHLNDNGVIEAMRYLLELAQNPKYRTDAAQPDTQREDEKL